MSAIKPDLFSIGMYDTVASRPKKWNCYAIVAWPRHLGFVVINAIKAIWLKTYGPGHIVKSFDSLTFETVRHLSKAQCSKLNEMIGDVGTSKKKDRFLALVRSCLEEDPDLVLTFRLARKEDGKHLDKLLSSLTPEQIVKLNESSVSCVELFSAHLVERLRKNEGDSAAVSRAIYNLNNDTTYAEISKSSELIERFTQSLDSHELKPLFRELCSTGEESCDPLTDRVTQLIVEKVIKSDPQSTQHLVDAIESSYKRGNGRITLNQLRLLIPHFSLNQLLQLNVAFANEDDSELVIAIYSQIEKESKRYSEEMGKLWSKLDLTQLNRLYQNHCRAKTGVSDKAIAGGVKLLRDFILSRAREPFEKGQKEIYQFKPSPEFLKAIVEGWDTQKLATYGSNFSLSLLASLETNAVKKIFAAKADDSLLYYVGVISKVANKGGFSEADVAIAVPAMEVILERINAGSFDSNHTETLKKLCDKSTGAYEYFLKNKFCGGDDYQQLAALILKLQKLSVAG